MKVRKFDSTIMKSNSKSGANDSNQANYSYGNVSSLASFVITQIIGCEDSFDHKCR